MATNYRFWRVGVLALVAGSVGCAHKPDANVSARSSDPPAIKDTPMNAQTRFAAGQLAEGQNRADLAITQYNEALKIEPNHLPSLYRLGVVYTQQKQYSKAIETWNRYIKATGGAAEAYSNLGFCQELAGDPAAAEASYRQGISKDPRSEPCRINYGLMLARRGNINEALIQLQVVLPPAKAHYDLGSVLQMQGRTAEARREYQRAVEIDPNMSDAKSKLASLQ